MHGTDSIATIRERAELIGFKFADLVKKSGIDYSTFSRLSSGARGGHVNSFRALNQALVEREIELRDYLNQLHPVAAGLTAHHSEAAE